MDASRTRPDTPGATAKNPFLTPPPTRPETPPAQARPCLLHRLANPAQQPRKSLFRK